MVSELEELQRSIRQAAYGERVALLDGLLAARAAVYPVRDEAYARVQAGSEAFALEMLAELEGREFRPDARQVEAAGDLADRPVFICGAMKSGTTLITQLLDGHPDLLVMPGDCHYAQRREQWDGELLEALASYWISRFISPSGKPPFWFLGREAAGMERFLNYLRHYRSEARLDAFQAVVLATHAALRPEPPFAKLWVEKTPENEKFAIELAERYPKARFIHILRDPLENLASLKRLGEFRGKEFHPKRRAKSLMKLFEQAERNARALGAGRYFVLQYAELVGDAEAVMRRLAGFLAIEFGETLLVPTENGRPGIANSMYAESRVEGRVLDQAGNRRFLEEFTPAEIREIVKICREPSLRVGVRLNEGARS